MTFSVAFGSGFEPGPGGVRCPGGEVSLDGSCAGPSEKVEIINTPINETWITFDFMVTWPDAVQCLLTFSVTKSGRGVGWG